MKFVGAGRCISELGQAVLQLFDQTRPLVLGQVWTLTRLDAIPKGLEANQPGREIELLPVVDAVAPAGFWVDCTGLIAFILVLRQVELEVGESVNDESLGTPSSQYKTSSSLDSRCMSEWSSLSFDRTRPLQVRRKSRSHGRLSVFSR